MTPAVGAPPAAVGDYARAVLAGDEDVARSVLTSYIGGHRTLAEGLQDVVCPALYEVGRLWQECEASVADEHLATATTQSVLARLFVERQRQQPSGRSVVVTSTEGELHALGCRFVADVLEESGWEVIHLGPSTPTAALVDLVRRRRPEAVALSTVRSANLPAAKSAFALLRGLDAAPVLVAGGRAYGDSGRLADSFGADLFVRDLADLPAALAAAVDRT